MKKFLSLVLFALVNIAALAGDAVSIDKLYAIGSGTDNGWEGTTEVPYDEEAQAFKFEFTATGTAYFAFGDAPFTDWGDFNANHRWAIGSGDQNATLNVATQLVKIEGTVVLSEPGDYTVCVTKAMVMTITKKEIPEPTYVYAVVGGSKEDEQSASIFATRWDAANTTDMMTLNETSGKYEWTKKAVEIATPHTIALKVIKKVEGASEAAAWYPSDNVEVPIAKAGKYNVTVTFDPSAADLFAQTTVTAVATEVPATVEITDELTLTTFGVSGTSYKEVTGKTATSDAVYYGQMAGGNSAIQLRSNNSNSGIVTTQSGGKVKTVTITWNTNTAATRTVAIYGSNTAYSTAADLYATETQGTLLGELNIDNATAGVSTLTVTDEYTYVGIRSKSGALYLDKVAIAWEAEAAAVEKPTFSLSEGEYVGTQSVTLACATEGAVLYYTTDGTEPTAESTAYSAAISIDATATLKAIAIKGENKSKVAAATYTILPSIANTIDNPLSIGGAAWTIEQNDDKTLAHPDNQVYVEGVIAQIDKYNETYKSITYWISFDGTTADPKNMLQCYSGKGLNGADFNALTDIAVGANVIVKGNLKKYTSGDNVTYELDKNNQLAKYTVPTAIQGLQKAPENAVIYNLNGQRLQKAQKGLNIINGKKVVIK